ncbi:MAG: hypothetical protein P8Z35_19850 [Ignavibacteriaceae bacterium]
MQHPQRLEVEKIGRWEEQKSEIRSQKSFKHSAIHSYCSFIVTFHWLSLLAGRRSIPCAKPGHSECRLQSGLSSESRNEESPDFN